MAWARSPVPLILLRADRSVCALNPAAERTLGATRSLPSWLASALAPRLDELVAHGHSPSSPASTWVVLGGDGGAQRVSVASLGEEPVRGARWLVSLERGAPSPTERLGLAQQVWALTDRELEVVALLSGGLSDRSIAAEMSVTEATVKYHLLSIRKKSETISRTDLLAKLFRL